MNHKMAYLMTRATTAVGLKVAAASHSRNNACQISRLQACPRTMLQLQAMHSHSMNLPSTSMRLQQLQTKRRSQAAHP